MLVSSSHGLHAAPAAAAGAPGGPTVLLPCLWHAQRQQILWRSTQPLTAGGGAYAPPPAVSSASSIPRAERGF